MSNNDWTPPTPDEVRSLRHAMHLRQDEMADLGRVTIRQIQRYESPEKTMAHQYPHRSVWELIISKLGIEPLDTSIRATVRKRQREG